MTTRKTETALAKAFIAALHDGEEPDVLKEWDRKYARRIMESLRRKGFEISKQRSRNGRKKR